MQRHGDKQKETDLAFVVYSTRRLRAIGLYDTKSAAQARVTRNNKQHLWELMSQNRSAGEEWAYCSWADFEAIALKSRRRGYQNYHEF